MRSFFSSRLFLFLVFIFLLIGTLIAALPSIVSTDWGRNQVTGWINRSIPGQVEISSLTLHWGKGQVLEGILLKDPEGQSVLGIEKFSTDATLWQLFRKSTRLGYTHLQELNAAIVTDENGVSNLQRALGLDMEGDYPRLPPSTILLSDVNGTISLFVEDNPLSAHLTGMTRQENLVGSFEIDIALPGLYANNWNELTQDAQNYLSIESSKDAKMHAKVINFPVDLLDRFVALKRPDLNTLFHSLLGDKLNLMVNKEPSAEGLAFNLTATSPLMQGEVKGNIHQGIFTLQVPAAFYFTLKPESINPFTHYRFELLEATRLKFLFQDLHMPLAFLDSEAKVDPCLLGFKAQAELPATVLEVFPIGEIKILSLKTLFESSLCRPTINVQVIGQGQQGRETFDIHFDSLLNKPANLRDLQSQLRKNMESSLTVSHLPLKMIAPLESYPGLIKQAGSFADLQLSLKQKGENDLVLTLSIHTPHLVLNQAQFKIGRELKLLAPVNLTWALTPECLQTLFSSEQFTLDQPCSILLTVNNLKIPLEEYGRGHLQLESIIKKVNLSRLTSLGSVQLQDIVLKIEGDSLSEFKTQLSSQLSLLKADGFYSPLLNHPVNFNLSSIVKVAPNEKFDFPLINMHMQSPSFKTKVEGRLTNQQIFALTHPLQISYVMTPQALQELNSIYHLNLPKLQSPSSINLTAEPTQIDLKLKSLALLNLKGHLTIDHIATKKIQGALPSLEELVMNWAINAPQNTVILDLKGFAYADASSKASQIGARANLYKWLSPSYEFNLDHLRYEVATDFTGLPTAFISALVNRKDLTPLIGPTMDIVFKTLIDRDQEEPGYWDMFIDSSRFHAKTRLKIDQSITLYESTSPSGEIRWTVTPESYHYIQRILSSEAPAKMTLAEPVVLAGKLTKLNIPLHFESKEEGQINFLFNTTPITWKELPSLSPFKLEGKIESGHLLEELLFSLRSYSKDSSLVIDGRLANLFDQPGKLNDWQYMFVQANAKGRQLPIPTLLFLDSKERNRVEALFGETLDTDLNIQLQQLTGSLEARIEGSNGFAKLKGKLTQGVLTLQDTFEWQIRVTPLLSRTLLEENMPLLSTAMNAENPLSLRIEPAGFSCQLIPFDFDKLHIEKGMIELGKIRFRNEGDLHSILSLIRPISDDQFTIWFTPLYFQLNQGKLFLKRLDMLIAHQYTLASWGEMDLNTKKMDLVLGLSAQSLGYAFNIQGLDPNYLLQIPIKGRKGSIEIDKKRAAGRISALVAQLHGNSKTKLLGNILEAALSNQLDPAPPPPTTKPFPWANEFQDLPESENHLNSNSLLNERDEKPVADTVKSSKKKKKKLKDLDAGDLIKGLEQGASGLLNQFMK